MQLLHTEKTMAKKKTIPITADDTQARATIGQLKDFTKKSMNESAKAVEKSSKDIAGAYKKMGIRTDASIRKSTKAAKDNYKQIKNSGTASAREVKEAHNKMTAKIKANNLELRGGAGMLSKVYSAVKGKIVGIGIAVVAAGFAIKKAFDFAEAGAKLQVMRKSFHSYAKSVGADGDDILAKLKEVSKGTVSEADLIASAGKAMLLGLAPDKLVTLLEVARAASKITGDSITKSFDDITTGVGRQSRMILDNLGIILRVGDANEKYAESLGKTVEELTEAEKKLAVLNATAEAGQLIITGVGEDTLTTADKIARMKVSFTEMIDKMKIFAADVFEKIEPGLNVMGKGFVSLWKGILVGVDGAISGMNALKFVILDAAKWTLILAKGFTFISDKLGITNNATATLNVMMKDLNKQMDKAARGMSKAGRKAIALEKAEEKLNRTTKESTSWEEKRRRAIEKTKEEATDAAKDRLKESEKTLEALKKQEDAQKEVNKVTRQRISDAKQALTDLRSDITAIDALLESIRASMAAADVSREQQGLTSAQVLIDNVNRAVELTKQADKAFKEGRRDEAIALTQAVIDARNAVASANKLEMQEAGISPAGLDEARILAEQLAVDVQEMATTFSQLQTDKIPGATAEIAKLEVELTTGKTILKEYVSLIKEATDEATKLKDKLSLDTTATHTQVIKTVQAQAEGGLVQQPIKARTGRYFPGYGGGDKIDIKGEAGEFMLRKEAVRDLSLQAAHAFNNRDIPALIASLTAPAQRMAEGGPVKPQGSTETVNLNLTAGGNTLKTTAPKDSTKVFIKSIKRMNITHGRGKRVY